MEEQPEYFYGVIPNMRAGLLKALIFMKEMVLIVNEPLATKMEAQPHDAKPFDLLKPQYRYYDYEFERYWHFFQVFGRMGYNPETLPMVWQKEFEMRFGKKAAP